VVDEEFRHPRLAALYDALDPDRRDLEAHVDLVVELGADRVLDVGCGTGALALLLAARGHDVIGVDPAAASVAVARRKPGADAVRWLVGDATSVTVVDRDVAVLTGNTAQAIWEPSAWAATLEAVHSCLRPGGHLVLETRDPEARAWQQWTRASTRRVHDVPGTGEVERWVEVTSVDWPLVSFRWTWVFAADGTTLRSRSTLRFRDRPEIARDLDAHGYDLVEVRGAPDRPGQELVVLARRRG
jgi:SAM-dependent methyltransferase